MTSPRQHDLVRLERPGHIVESTVEWVNPRSGALVLTGWPEPFIPSEWASVIVAEAASERSMRGLQQLADERMRAK